ncbi:MAG: glycosyltransferase [Candidatus Peribacteraceae bacterium]
MKVALVHELLTMRGGAERVLRVLADIFPDAPIYTLLYDEKKLGDWFPTSRIRTSSCQPTSHYPLATNHSFNHHHYLRRFPKAAESWNFSDFDLVISSSSAFAHGIITNGKPKHLCYVHSPARYLWDRTHDVIGQASKGPFGFLKKKYVEHVFHKLRIWDAEAAYRPDMLLSASKTVQRRCELYWRRESDVLYPPIDDAWFQATRYPLPATRSGYLLVSSLVRYKRIDLAIEACNQLKLPLTIVGEGPDEMRLRNLAGPTVTFHGYTDQEELRSLYASSVATIFPGDEDFGLVPLESMACGTPVIAFRSGGALETVIEGKTGVFFDAPTTDSLVHVLQSFDQNTFSAEACLSQARKHSKERFVEEMHRAVTTLMAD